MKQCIFWILRHCLPATAPEVPRLPCALSAHLFGCRESPQPEDRGQGRDQQGSCGFLFLFLLPGWC